MPKISVVFLNWNRAEATLASLRRASGWRRAAPVVWVVDNGSTDGAAERIAAEFPAVRLIASAANRGFGGGNNLALREISDGHVLLLNNDAVIAEDDVLRLAAALDRHPEVAVVGPLFTREGRREEVVAAGGRDIARHVGTHWGPRRLSAQQLAGDEPVAVAYVPGTAAMLRAGLLGEIGLLDEDYFFGGELADLCERARRRGYVSAVVPSARAWHDTHQASGLRETLYPYYILRNRFLFVRKFRRRWRPLLVLFWTAYGVFSVAAAALGGRARRARLAALALADGLAGRFGGQNERVGA
jgi:GT2 family glycosyltransferase